MQPASPPLCSHPRAKSLPGSERRTGMVISAKRGIPAWDLEMSGRGLREKRMHGNSHGKVGTRACAALQAQRAVWPIQSLS